MQKYEHAGEEDRLYIMQYKEFINLIINSKCANVKPFSGRFSAADLELLKEKVQKGGKHEEGFDELYEVFVRVSKMMNDAYNQLYAEQRGIIYEMKTPAFDIISHLVALVNCNFCGVFTFLNAKLAERANSIQRFSVLSATKVQSVDSEVGELPLDGALEFQIDMLSMLINYVRYFRTEKYDSPSLTGKKYWESLKKLLWNANVLCALKDDYDILEGETPDFVNDPDIETIQIPVNHKRDNINRKHGNNNNNIHNKKWNKNNQFENNQQNSEENFPAPIQNKVIMKNENKPIDRVNQTNDIIKTTNMTIQPQNNCGQNKFTQPNNLKNHNMINDMNFNPNINSKMMDPNFPMKNPGLINTNEQKIPQQNFNNINVNINNNYNQIEYILIH